MRSGIVIPAELARSREISRTGKILYLAALADRPQSIRELAEVAGVDSGHASRVCAELVKTGWMRMDGSTRKRLPMPAMPAVLQEQRARRLSKLLELVPQKGEFLMKCWLDLLVASDDFVDNARPGFLRNPTSGDVLEFDRYYLEGVAFEFNGWQHYGPTAVFPDEQVFKEQRTRDLVKKGLSQELGIILIEITSDDLSLASMTSKIPSILPVNAIDKDGPYVRALARLCQNYRVKAEQRQPDKD